VETYAVLWKELKDLLRDRRTLIAVVVLPLISLPLLGAITLAIYRTQPIAFGVVNQDNSTISKEAEQMLLQYIEMSAESSGQKASFYSFSSLQEALRSQKLDYVILIPEGFGLNLSNISRAAFLEGYKRADTARADAAESIFSSAVSYLSSFFSQKRVEALLKYSNISASSSDILQPVRILQSSYMTGGAPAPPTAEELTYTARMLAFALFFVTTPAVSYMVDSIMGEKERKTLESLLSLPIKRRSLLGGKILASSVVGMMAGLADIIGVIVYFYLLSEAYGGGSFFMDAGLVIVHSLDVAATAFATCAIVSPFVVSARSSRGANATSAAVTGIAMVIFFLALLADVSRLPSYAYLPLLVIPYMNSVLVLMSYVQGSLSSLIFHASLLLGETALFYMIAFRLFKPELLLMPPSFEE